ncbi:MFS transporter [Maribacter sp. 2307ULW6-5]|uniref:MFS transporter n=1 Tax=Maribacter sp. 2307ULW6-5 TaxID=3386275 RepID=UPI0039BD8635
MRPKPHILPVIIGSQFACTSLWFAGNAVMDDLVEKTGLGPQIMGYVLSSVQLGFIVGTLVFSVFTVADRFSPSRVFFCCALLAATCNALLLLNPLTASLLLLARFGTGFFLAGIYPVGMKIAADHFERGLGKALGFLVGALVLGSALPYLLSGVFLAQPPARIVLGVSLLAVFGGALLWAMVPNGPFRAPGSGLRWRRGVQLFKMRPFRKASFGYFGHMWELYAFWAFTPLALSHYAQWHNTSLNVPLWTGIVMLLGALSCAWGGMLSQKYGSGKVAFVALATSGACCLLSPFFFFAQTPLFLSIWCFWGMAVTADSPQFSNLVAGSAPPNIKGTGLTLVNGIGFAITIGSIQLLESLGNHVPVHGMFTILALGPIIGLWQLGAGPNRKMGQRSRT